MAEIYGNSATIGATEHSLPNNSTTLTPIATANTIQLFLDASAIAAGDEFELRIYEKVLTGGSQVLVFPIVTLTSGIDAWVSPALRMEHGYDVTLLKAAGTDRSISWSIRTP